MEETRMCPKCKEPNPIRNLHCLACGASMTGVPTTSVSGRLPEAAVPPEPVPEGKWRCLNCKTLNPDWRTSCEHCKATRGLRYISYPQTEEVAFGGSLGIGCGALIVTNVITNALLRLGMAMGLLDSTGILICANVVLLFVIGAAAIAFFAKSKSLHWGGIAVAIGIYILIQIIMIPLLQSIR
ncbi:MAG: zinc ribbon domain-containing protein [Anaerolineae bacterium]|nr:zinc ribbon domain-containing protein [Anaerolineae bacterium]